MLGHVLGLAISGTPVKELDASFQGLGIECNTVGGQATGVSLARFRKLVVLLAGAWQESPTSPAIALLLRAVWEKALPSTLAARTFQQHNPR